MDKQSAVVGGQREITLDGSRLPFEQIGAEEEVVDGDNTTTNTHCTVVCATSGVGVGGSSHCSNERVVEASSKRAPPTSIDSRIAPPARRSRLSVLESQLSTPQAGLIGSKATPQADSVSTLENGGGHGSSGVMLKAAASSTSTTTFAIPPLPVHAARSISRITERMSQDRELVARIGMIVTEELDRQYCSSGASDFYSDDASSSSEFDVASTRSTTTSSSCVECLRVNAQQQHHPSQRKPGHDGHHARVCSDASSYDHCSYCSQCTPPHQRTTTTGGGTGGVVHGVKSVSTLDSLSDSFSSSVNVATTTTNNHHHHHHLRHSAAGSGSNHPHHRPHDSVGSHVLSSHGTSSTDLCSLSAQEEEFDRLFSAPFQRVFQSPDDQLEYHHAHHHNPHPHYLNSQQSSAGHHRPPPTTTAAPLVVHHHHSEGDDDDLPTFPRLIDPHGNGSNYVAIGGNVEEEDDGGEDASSVRTTSVATPNSPGGVLVHNHDGTQNILVPPLSLSELATPNTPSTFATSCCCSNNGAVTNSTSGVLSSGGTPHTRRRRSIVPLLLGVGLASQAEAALNATARTAKEVGQQVGKVVGHLWVSVCELFGIDTHRSMKDQHHCTSTSASTTRTSLQGIIGSTCTCCSLSVTREGAANTSTTSNQVAQTEEMGKSMARRRRKRSAPSKGNSDVDQRFYMAAAMLINATLMWGVANRIRPSGLLTPLVERLQLLFFSAGYVGN